MTSTSIPCLDQRRSAALRRGATLADRSLARFAGELLARFAAALLFVLVIPVLLIALVAGCRVHSFALTGRRGRQFQGLRLMNSKGQTCRWIGHAPLLWNVVRGNIDWVGPQPRTAGELDLRHERDRQVVSVAPGIVSNWWVRQRTSIAWESQAETDVEFAETWTPKAKLGIFARALLAGLYGRAGETFPRIANILGLPVDNITLSDAVDQILTPSLHTKQVSFLNVDCVNKAVTDLGYRQILTNSDLRLADGIGLRIGGKLLKSPIRENVNGTDLFPRLCASMEGRNLSIYLLGGREGVAERVAAWLEARYPSLRIAGLHHGYFGPDEDAEVCRQIEQSGADILLVAFGAPLQERWIHRNLGSLKVRAALGVGGLFDFYSGRISRAPQWLREVGLEWTYRLYQEPGRMWRRYLLGNAIFMFRIFAAQFRQQFFPARIENVTR